MSGSVQWNGDLPRNMNQNKWNHPVNQSSTYQQQHQSQPHQFHSHPQHLSHQNRPSNHYPNSAHLSLSRGAMPSAGRGRGRARGGGSSSNSNFQSIPSFHSHPSSRDRPPEADSSSHRGSRGNIRGSGGRGRGRGRGNGRVTSSFDSPTSSSLPKGVTDGQSGHLICDHPGCSYRTDQTLALTLHRADRHLIYPEGGEEEMKRLDPMLIEEENEKRKKERKRKRRDDEDEEEDETTLPLIPGLNISLSTPALIEYWREERRKRWPRASVLEKKLQEQEEAKIRGEPKSSHLKSRSQKKTRLEIGAKETERMEDGEEEDDGNEDSNESRSQDSDDDSDSEEAEARDEAEADPDRILDDSDSDIEATLDELASRLPKEEGEEDGPPESISSKVSPPPLKSSMTNDKQDRRPLCSFFIKGSCSFGETCRKRHERPDSANKTQSNSNSMLGKNFRPHPRPQSRNPFEAPQLELALLRAEISQHVSAVAQCVRFLVQNNWLDNVALEIEAGEENEETRNDEMKGKLIEVIHETSNEADPKIESKEETAILAPLVPGGSSSIPSSEVPGARSLISTTSSKVEPLRKISSLEFPPEPSALIYLDPLRRDEPKPLRRIQFEALSTDPHLRRILSGQGISTSLDPLMISMSLKRALKGLDSLPTDEHRISALELILGVSTQSSVNPHNELHQTSSYSNHLKMKNQIPAIETSGSHGGNSRRKRVITEREILDLGLRIGPDEAQAIRFLAARVSEVALVPFMGNPEDATRNLGLGHLGQALALAGGAPDFDARGWGAVMRERERENEKFRVWKQLGLEMD